MDCIMETHKSASILNVITSCFNKKVMIKKSVILLLFVFLSFCGKSQQTIEYGIQGGLNLSSASISGNGPQPGLLAGFNVGAQVKITRTKNFAIKTVLQYEQRGFIYKDLSVEYPGNSVGKADISSRMNYIDLKVLPVLKVGSVREFYVYAGPAIGILVSNKLITKFKDPLPAGNPSTVATKGSDRKSTNFGLALGIGTQLPIGDKIKFSFDVRSDFGLSNVYKNGNVKLRSFSFSPGILFNLR